jgi:hypothetical protein
MPLKILPVFVSLREVEFCDYFQIATSGIAPIREVFLYILIAGIWSEQ